MGCWSCVCVCVCAVVDKQKNTEIRNIVWVQTLIDCVVASPVRSQSGTRVWSARAVASWHSDTYGWILFGIACVTYTLIIMQMVDFGEKVRADWLRGHWTLRYICRVTQCGRVSQMPNAKLIFRCSNNKRMPTCRHWIQCVFWVDFVFHLISASHWTLRHCSCT